ncbi:hypothetical protein PC114_g10477 [Phytophthora cactorum]|nr:hypothetical protein PC114_g10477 [Phytophthora cactorum]
MPSTPQSTKKQRQHERAAANARVVRAFKESANWREVAAHNDVPYSTARRAALNADGEPTTHGGVRGVRVKMTMKVMGKLEQYLDEDCRHTCEQIACSLALLSTASAAVQQGVKCGQKLVTVVENIVGYAKELQSNFPNGTEEQIISLLNNSDIVVKDLPTAVCICLGLDVPTDYLNLASDVVSVVDKVLSQVVEKGSLLLSVIRSVKY